MLTDEGDRRNIYLIETKHLKGFKMNIQTVNYISAVAGFAKDQMLSGKSLKWAKEYVSECLDEAASPLECDGVDMVAASLTLSILIGENRKARFEHNANGIVSNMNVLREKLVALSKVSPSMVRSVKAIVECISVTCNVFESVYAKAVKELNTLEIAAIMEAFGIFPASSKARLQLQEAIKVIATS